jgi:bisphosphoglycerate-dependent phosphoglycerate mutase
LKLIIVFLLDGQTLKSAADMYGLSKTVLWRKSQMLNPPNKKKKPCYSLEQKLAAVDALKSGEKTRKVAEDFVSLEYFWYF